MKTWIEKDGRDLFGAGRYALLREVRRTGSLSRAAHNLGMSYRAAWGKVREAEGRLGFSLLDRKRGGARGGGSTLTGDGERLLKAFEEFERELGVQAQRLLKKHLGFLSRPGKP